MTFLQKIRHLYGLDEAENYGYTITEIFDLEKRLSIVLPKAIREYYLQLAKCAAINDTFNRLLTPKTEIGLSTDKYLVFFEENQSVVYWGIKEQDLQLGNPPVYTKYSSENLQQEWEIDSSTTENFLLSMAFWNGVLGGLTYNANTEYESDLSEEVIHKVEKNWKEIKGITNQNLRFFTNDYSEIIAFTLDSDAVVNGIYIGSNDEEKYQNIVGILNIEWDYRTDRDE